MTNVNTLLHISDKAESVIVDNNKKYTNLQDFINDLNPKVFDGETLASETEYGIGMLSDKLLKNKKLVTNKVLKSAKLDSLATETTYGKVYVSDNKDLISTTAGDNKLTNPKNIKYFIDNFTANQKDFGFVKMIDNSSIVNYIGNDVAINVENLSYSMDYMIPKLGRATTSNSGTVRIATSIEAKEGKENNGVVVSPKKFHSMVANTTAYGLIKHSTQKEFTDYNTNTGVTTSNLVFTKKLMDDVGKSASDLSAKIAKDRQAQDKYIRDEINKIIGNYSSGSISKYIRVGDLVYSLRKGSRSGEYMIPTGQFINKNSYPVLFSIIGYRYGQSGENFRLPDLRGLYFRHNGLGTNITNHDKYRSFGVPYPEYGVVQRQMVARHKHGGNWCDQSRHGSSFGHTGNWGWRGSSGEHWNCYAMYQTDGGEIISESGIRDYPNPEGMINKDKETRPWTMAVNVYMRVK